MPGAELAGDVEIKRIRIYPAKSAPRGDVKQKLL